MLSSKKEDIFQEEHFWGRYRPGLSIKHLHNRNPGWPYPRRSVGKYTQLFGRKLSTLRYIFAKYSIGDTDAWGGRKAASWASPRRGGRVWGGCGLSSPWWLHHSPASASWTESPVVERRCVRGGGRRDCSQDEAVNSFTLGHESPFWVKALRN